MEKAFDVKVLVQKLAAQGLPLAEEAAELLVATVFEWTEESAAVHPNAIVRAAVPLAIQVVKPIVKESLNKIDGQVG